MGDGVPFRVPSAFLVALLPEAPAASELIEVDLQTQGDGLVTRDTATRLLRPSRDDSATRRLRWGLHLPTYQRSPHTQIVAIGAKIDAQELDEKFAACIARP